MFYFSFKQYVNTTNLEIPESRIVRDFRVVHSSLTGLLARWIRSLRLDRLVRGRLLVPSEIDPVPPEIPKDRRLRLDPLVPSVPVDRHFRSVLTDQQGQAVHLVRTVLVVPAVRLDLCLRYCLSIRSVPYYQAGQIVLN